MIVSYYPGVEAISTISLDAVLLRKHAAVAANKCIKRGIYCGIVESSEEKYGRSGVEGRSRAGGCTVDVIMSKQKLSRLPARL